MTKFGISQPVRRVEDVRFLKGEGNYVEDIQLPNTARAVFVRATVAHADITVDASEATNATGVLMVLTGADLEDAIDNDMDKLTLENIDGSTSATPKRPILALGRARYVGEQIACVIAETVDPGFDGRFGESVLFRCLGVTGCRLRWKNELFVEIEAFPDTPFVHFIAKSI